MAGDSDITCMTILQKHSQWLLGNILSLLLILNAVSSLLANANLTSRSSLVYIRNKTRMKFLNFSFSLKKKKDC